MFAEVRRRLAQAARPGGLLLVLDDLQWADEASAVLLADVVRQLRGTAGVVARILDVPVLALLGPLDECRAAGFLVAWDRPGDHRFSHALVRSAVAARLSAPEQRRLHAAAADAIEALYEGRLDLHLTEVARHRVAASLPGDRTEAVAACEAAAGVAAQSLAFEEAVRLYRQALSAGGEEIGENDRSRLELALAAALHRSGDLPGSQATAAGVGRRVTPQPPRARGGPAGRAGTNEQADRPDPVRLRTDGREPRPAHPDQARAPQPQPDRRLGQRRAWRESSMSTQADGE